MSPASVLLRRDIAELNRLMANDVSRMWAGAETVDAVEEALRDVLPELIATYGSAAATVAADWYDDLRERASAPKRFTAIPAQITETGTQALIGWAKSEATDFLTFQGFVLAGSQRRMANFSRFTVTGSSTADPSARGWRRVGVGECDFCQMLLDRGAVYSEATADFEAHDGCQCGAEPEFV